MKYLNWKKIICIFTLFTAFQSFADDIDIFDSNANVANAGINVLVVVANGASWGSQLGDGQTASEAIHRALYQLITSDEVDLKGVRLGIMSFVSNNNPRGGKVIAAMQDLNEQRIRMLTCRLYKTAPGPTGRCPLVVGQENIAKTNNSPYALSLNEAFLYFSGKSPRSGLGDGVYAATTNPSGYDSAAVDSAMRYVSPALINPCSKNILIVIGTGDPDSGENTDAQSLLAQYGGVLNGDPVVLNPSQFQSSWGDEYARYFRSVDINNGMDGNQSITTYVIDVFASGASINNPFLAARAYYKSMARLGGGAYFSASSAQGVIAGLKDAFSQAQAVNGAFAAASLPISVNVQGVNNNQVYIGMFRPDAEKKPRWVGNLKKYQYKFDDITKAPFLADQRGLEAYNSASGFIRDDASSYWTVGSDYWRFLYQSSPSDNPDGALVEKGAAGQQLRGRTEARNLYTCAGGCSQGGALKSFSADNASVANAFSLLGGAAGAQILSWARGADIEDENGNGNYAEPRSSIHGDVLHSRPAVVNYFRSGSVDRGQDVVVFYGSNDGMFRAVEGATGRELWAFVPEEQFPGLKRLYDNTVVGAVYGKRPYFSDGNVTIISNDVNGDGRLESSKGDKVWAFITMRRGGRYLYALDVSDPSTPKFMWKKTSADEGFSELGQTWSTPGAAYVKPLGKTPVLIFGAGYDAAAEDYVPGAGARPGRTQGRGLFMLYAETGNLYWKTSSVPGMEFSVPGDVAMVSYSRGSGNFAERLYFGDTGGNLWRADISSTNLGDWVVTRIAELGGCSATSNSDCRKFLYAPSVVRGADGGLALLVGSGDREHPFEKTVQNRFYMIKDPVAGKTVTHSNLTNVTSEASSVKVDDPIDGGWFFDLRPGEKVSGPALTIQGVTHFATNEPAIYSPTSCSSNLGTAREYYVNYADGTAVKNLLPGRSVEAPGGGFLPPPIAVSLIRGDDANGGDEVWTGIGGLRPQDVGIGQPGARQRTYWQKSID